MDLPFWETAYKEENTFPFGTQPNQGLVEYESMYKKSWNVLDIGCGDGKNALYLALKGFSNVDAFDLSENGIEKLHTLAEKDDLRINAWVQDLRHFSFGKQYDLIYSFGTLHFAEKTEWKSLLEKAKENTSVGGIHVIHIFTNTLPASPDIAPYAAGLADEGEIRLLYKEWDVLQFKSYTFEDEHPGAPKHSHAVNQLIAQRTK